MEAAMAEMQYAGSGAIRGDPFQQLTSMVTNKRRMSAVKEARANGLTPDMGDPYYGFIRDRLTDFGDMQGAEMIEGKRMAANQLKIDADYKKAQTEGALLDNKDKTQALQSNRYERKLQMEESTVRENARRTDLMEKEQRWKEDTWESPEDKWEYTKREIGLRNAGALDLENLRYKHDLDIKQAELGGKYTEVGSGQINIAGQDLLGTMVRNSTRDNDPNATTFNKQWEGKLGMPLDELTRGLAAKKNTEEYVRANAALATASMEIATKKAALQRAMPGQDEMNYWTMARNAPAGARLGLIDGKPVWGVPTPSGKMRYFEIDTSNPNAVFKDMDDPKNQPKKPTRPSYPGMREDGSSLYGAGM